jgi:hypothetical protein
VNLARDHVASSPALVKVRLKWVQYWPGLLGGFLVKTKLGLPYA